MASWTVEKCPQKYDNYKFTLDAEHLEKARLELNETDENREQSLAQMRDWIAKHTHIRKCRTDSLFLLRFLRMRKFSVPRAQELLERYLAVRQSIPHWFKNLDPLDKEIRDFNDTDMFFYLGHDTNRRTVIFMRARAFNPDRFTVTHQVRQVMMILETTLDQDETQVNGYVVICDYREITLKQLAVWSISDSKKILDCIFQSLPVRIKQIHAIGVPKMMTMLIDLFNSCISEKTRNRVFCHRSLEDAKKHRELSILDQNMDQLKHDFIMDAEKKRQDLLLMDEMEIDTTHYKTLWQRSNDFSEVDAGLVGTFKRLNVD